MSPYLSFDRSGTDAEDDLLLKNGVMPMLTSCFLSNKRPPEFSRLLKFAAAQCTLKAARSGNVICIVTVISIIALLPVHVKYIF